MKNKKVKGALLERPLDNLSKENGCWYEYNNTIS